MLFPLQVPEGLTAGTYPLVIARSWRADIRTGMPGPCTPTLTVLTEGPRLEAGLPSPLRTRKRSLESPAFQSQSRALSFVPRRRDAAATSPP